MAFDKKKFIVKFAEEARDHIAKLNEGLVSLETDPDNADTLNQIFRSAHTIKGSSKILSLNEINLVSHKLEDSLDALREKKIPQTRELFNLIFRTVDMIAGFVEKAEAGEDVGADVSGICKELELAAKGKLAEGAEAPPQPAPAVAPKTGPALSAVETLPVPATAAAKAEAPPKPVPATAVKTVPKSSFKPAETVRISIDKLDETVKLMGEIVSNHIRMKQNLVDIDEIGRIAKKYLETLSRTEQGSGGRTNGAGEEIFETAWSIYQKLKRLSGTTRDVLSFQTLLTDGLREKVLKMRMLPLSTALDAFPRLVRDIAATCNKNIHFAVEGGETEMDKKIIEKIGDPLLHMIRNSLDHGIEPPEERAGAGKPAAGTIRLSAGYEGGNVLIQLSDDGGGIPVKKIKEKALKKKMYDEETLNAMSEREIVNLIFKPGFSTSPIITDISGRGVGMDVVKENIVMQLKGSIQIETAEGKGTTFLIRLPLTLAVMRVLLVAVGRMEFAIPLNAVREIVRVPADKIIEVVNKRAISLRDQIVPIVDLDVILKVPEKPGRKGHEDEVLAVMVAMGSENLGLIVDSIVSEEDMEIKSLPAHMKKNETVSGVTLTGKNEIALMLHVPKLFALAKESADEKVSLEKAEEETKAAHILLVEDSVSTREIEKSILSSYGYKVETAVDGLDGLEKAKEARYDLVITDIEMPRMDGFALTEKLRETEEYRNTPIVIVSSRDSESDKKRGMQVGADAYIIKGGFDQTSLLATIQNLIP